MAEVLCRRARSDEAAVVGRLRWGLVAEHDGADPALAAEFIAHFAAGFDEPTHVHWVGEVEGQVLAVMTVVVVTKTPTLGETHARWGYLTNVYTRPKARDLGIGGRLLEAVTAWAREERFELLLVWPSERAVPFYERAGFRSTRDPLVLDLT